MLELQPHSSKLSDSNRRHQILITVEQCQVVTDRFSFSYLSPSPQSLYMWWFVLGVNLGSPHKSPQV